MDDTKQKFKAGDIITQRIAGERSSLMYTIIDREGKIDRPLVDDRIIILNFKAKIGRRFDLRGPFQVYDPDKWVIDRNAYDTGELDPEDGCIESDLKHTGEVAYGGNPQA